MSEVETVEDLNLNWREKLTIFVLLFSNFVEGILALFLSSFFPLSAFEKGLNETVVGFIISAFQISAIISTFLFKHFATFVSSRKMFLCSYILSGVILIPFMFVDDIQSKVYFCITSFLCRTVQGFSAVGISFSSMNIITSNYKSRISTLVGAVKLLLGAGIAIGPFLSATAFQYLGFKGPFYTMILIIVITLIISYYFVHPSSEREDESTTGEILEKSAFRMALRVPEIPLMVLSMIIVGMHLSFNEFILTTYLMNKFNMSIIKAGSFLMISPTIFSILSPFLGYFIDQKGYAMTSYFTGSIIILISWIFIGPAPPLHMKQHISLLIPMLAIDGLGVSLQAIPGVVIAYYILRLKDVELIKSWEQYINLITLMPSYVGSLLGPFLGGMILQNTNFAWTQFIMAIMLAIVIIIVALCFYRAINNGQKNLESMKLLN